MLSYSQRDPKWANKFLGSSKLTIGRFGCTITSIADLSTYFGDNYTPFDVSKICKFTPAGLLYWNSCQFGSFRFVSREYNRDDNKILQHLKDPNLAVILEVAGRSHWVVATGTEGHTNLYKIADPWLGDRSTMKRYNNNITGAAYFRRK